MPGGTWRTALVISLALSGPLARAPLAGSEERPATPESTAPPAAASQSAAAADLWTETSSSWLDSKNEPGHEVSVGWVAGRVTLAVALVASLVALLMILLRRFGGASAGRGAPRLQLLATLSLGPRRNIHLLRADGIELLISATQDGVRMLTELPASDLPALSAPAETAPAAGNDAELPSAATVSTHLVSPSPPMPSAHRSSDRARPRWAQQAGPAEESIAFDSALEEMLAGPGHFELTSHR